MPSHNSTTGMSPPFPNQKWWGWGSEKTSFPKKEWIGFVTLLAHLWGWAEIPKPTLPIASDQISIPPSRLPDLFLKKWESRGLSVASEYRLSHCTGKSYRDLIRLRSGKIPSFPDGVLFLQTSEDLVELYEDAQKAGLSLIPFGGGTGVVGGTESIDPNHRPVLVVDLKALSRFLSLDPISRVATFEAGILGPALEEHLNRLGWTLGHFPQSFEFSTLGGWIATRSAGQASIKYGKIEKMIESLTLISPEGTLKTKPVPASATGPSLKDLLIGSEGIFGIITEVTVRIVPMPEKKNYLAAILPDFETGSELIREILQAGLDPAVLRLSDGEETGLFFKLAAVGKGALMQHLQKLLGWVQKTPREVYLFAVLEGSDSSLKKKILRLIRKKNGRILLGRIAGKKWEKSRFMLPYLRDTLLDYGILIDTLETSAEWSRLGLVYEAVEEAIRNASPLPVSVGCHLSHAYPQGASLYFTFLSPQMPGEELAQWEKIKAAATDALMQAGGALSHHHGIGYDHRKWMGEEQSSFGLEILRRIKKDFDSAGILNPGKTL